MSTSNERVMLRSEQTGADSRHLWAYLDASGNLHIDGQDLGPGTAPVSRDGEYEWFQTIKAVDVARLVELLGGERGTGVLDVLKERYTGPKSYQLEKVVRESGIPVERFIP